MSDAVAQGTDGVSPDASPSDGKAETMATTKEQIRAGQTLVAKYKKQQHTCEVVEHDEATVLRAAEGPGVQESLGGRQGGHRHGDQRLPLLVDPRPAARGTASASTGRTGCRSEPHIAAGRSICFPSRGPRVRIPSPAPTTHTSDQGLVFALSL